MPKILIIDDEKPISEMLSASLQAEGFETVVALDGTEGVEAAIKHLPDLIVCDIVMPRLDGFGTLRTLREHPATATIPFIFLTGQWTKDNMRLGMELGADDFLTKPVVVGDLVAAIHSRIQRQQLLRQESDRRLDELRVNLSLSLPHEIRTPLSGIVGFAEVLRDDSASLQPGEISDMARIILKSATRLGHMVENFLTYAQLEMLAAASASRKFTGKEATVMLDLHVEEISGKKAKEFDRVNDLSLSLGGAEAAISTQSAKRIIEELVDNAFKFSRAGQKVEVETRGEDEHWFLDVRDHGVGMEQQEIAQIGAYRQFGRKSREQQGSGLGLSIAKKMTELYGGVFSIQSEVGNGTTVSVRIPRPLAV